MIAGLILQAVIASAPIDTSQLASKADVAAVQANACPPGTVTPQIEVVLGAPGSASTCLRSDARLPRITRAAVVTTDANGGWSVNWTTSLSAAPATLPIPMLPAAGTQPIVCLPITSTANGSTGRCFYARTLPATITVVTNLVSYDVFGAAASGITVQVFAIPTTQ